MYQISVNPKLLEFLEFLGVALAFRLNFKHSIFLIYKKIVAKNSRLKISAGYLAVV